MTRVLLVRHAMHDWVGRGIAGRMPTVTLNGEGELQAQDLARRLAHVTLDAIFSSPQPRARQTARPLAAAKGLHVTILDEFDEIGFGEWEGLTFAELQARYAAGWHEWIHRRSMVRVPGGESFPAVRDRAMAGLRRMCSDHPQGTVLVVSHGDVIKAVAATQLAMSLDQLETFDIACTSVTIIDVAPGWSQLKQLNGTTA